MSAAERLDAIADDIRMAKRSPEMARHLALDHGPQMLAAIRAVLELHKPTFMSLITGDCVTEECDHEYACPEYPIEMCGGCMERAEEVSPYVTESGAAMARMVYPCDDVRVITAALGDAS